jgi:hypothetical protein
LPERTTRCGWVPWPDDRVFVPVCTACWYGRREDRGQSLRRGTMSFSARWPSGLLLYCLANAYRSGHAYYLILFSSGRPTAPTRSAHCFGTFVRAWGNGGRVEAYDLDAHTISWLPLTLDLQTASLVREPGVNLSLRTTLEHVLSKGQQVWQWGPFAIDPLLYEQAQWQEKRLASGRVLFRALDEGYADTRVCGSFHAISDLAAALPRPAIRPGAWGESAGRLLTLHLRPWLLDPQELHPWVATRLGLQEYPIVARDMRPRRPMPRRHVIPPPLPRAPKAFDATPLAP